MIKIMEHLNIDNEKCIKCDRCVQDCPMGIPEVDDNGTYYSNEDNACICIYCGHCVSVCPVKAVTLNPNNDKATLEEMADYGIIPFSLSPEECPPSEIGNLPLASQVESLIKSRRMTRSFKKDLVPRDVTDHIFHEVLTYVPSGHNARGYNALIIEGRQKLEHLGELSLDCFKEIMENGSLHSFDVKVHERIIAAWKNGKDRIFRTANQAVAIYCKEHIVPSDPALKFILTYFEMLANSMGIGTVWAGYFMRAVNTKPVKEYLGIADDEVVLGVMMFGYPEFDYPMLPKRPDIEVKYF